MNSKLKNILIYSLIIFPIVGVAMYFITGIETDRIIMYCSGLTVGYIIGKVIA